MIAPFTASSDAFTEFPPARNFIGGEWCDPHRPGRDAGGAQSAPRPGDEPGDASAAREDVEAAVTAGESAFQEWRHWPMRERAQVLYRSPRAHASRSSTSSAGWSATRTARPSPRPRPRSIKGIECLEFGCSLPNAGAGGQLDVSRGVTCETVDEPLGVVAGIVPFNFPLMVPLWMLPAGAGGRERLHPQAERAGAAATPAPRAAGAGGRAARGRPQPRPGRARGGRGARGSPGHQGARLRRLDPGRPERLCARGGAAGSARSAWAARRTTSSSCPTPIPS